eukprot:Pgem_evm1s16943
MNCMTSLRFAITKRYPDINKALIAAGANVNDAEANANHATNNNVTALMFAVEHVHLEIAKALIDVEANANHVTNND